MNRQEMLQNLKDNPTCDILIIGGGATGLGAAVDAASRGFRTVLLEQHDFAKGTSSRSTKLIHGGLRYLEQGNIALVIEALRERGLLCANAPHLVHHLPFLVPLYKWWEGPFYGAGLKFYDLLAGKLGIEPSRRLSRQETIRAIPTLERKGLRGGSIYYDGQFDDTRLAITLAQTAADHGAILLNYVKVRGVVKKGGLITGVRTVDVESGKRLQIRAAAVVNATGIFADKLRQADDRRAKPVIAPSQGVHLVLPKSFMPGESAILVPHTDDGRVIFLVPWHDKVIVGTTDTPVKKPVMEPEALKKEVAFLLKHAGRYLEKDPSEKDVLSVFAGLRPLVKAAHAKDTAALSRDHTVMVSHSGLITIAGGKWTTYRRMAQDVINKAMLVGGLPERASVTKTLHLHGFKQGVDPRAPLATYGSDAKQIRALMRSNKMLRKKIHPRLPYTVAEVVYAVRFEMARSVEDVLARRTRALFLDARASVEAAPKIARVMAKELSKGKGWEKAQCEAFETVARKYLL